MCARHSFTAYDCATPLSGACWRTFSKGLCVLLLPSTQEFRFSFLHTLRTLCAYGHGLYHIASARPDLDRLATFLSLPNATFNCEPCIFNQGSWLLTHQINYFGTWNFLPLAMQLMKGKLTFLPYVSAPTFRSQIIGNCQGISTGRNSVTGNPLELFLVFGDGGLHLTTGNNNFGFL